MDTTATLFLPPGGSTIASEVDALFYFMVYASIVMFGIVLAGMIFLGLRYRHRKGQDDDDDGHHRQRQQPGAGAAESTGN